jgi:ComF family protein
VSCRKQTRLFAVLPCFRYEDIAKDLLWRLKFERARSAAEEIAVLMLPHIDWSSAEWLVPVPTAPARVRIRGYDQAYLIARELSRLSGTPLLSSLARYGSSRQVGMKRAQRQAQLAGAFRVRKPDYVRGSWLLLVDDVVTTGATLEAATAALKTAGAARVSAVTFAQA